MASEWGSKHGGLSTFNRELAIQLTKCGNLKVSMLLPKFDQEEKKAAMNNKVTLVQATRMPGFDDETHWLCSPPDDLQMDFVIGHGAVLGRQALIIRQKRQCKWIQFVHTDPEELSMHKNYTDAIPKGTKKLQNEVDLCAEADFVVAVGLKLAEAYQSYLRFCKKDKKVYVFTPGIFSEFFDAAQGTKDGDSCRVLVFGRGDQEDFSLKGFDIAAKAVAKLSHAHLIFVGAPEGQQDKVVAHFKKCKMPLNRLKVRTFNESREDLKKLFSEGDLAIMPSRAEGFGLTALEALSAGLPVLACANSGFGKAMSKIPFGSGCLMSSEDAADWAKEIDKVWKKDRVIRLTEAGVIRDYYAKEYIWKEQCRVVVKEMRRILKG